ncbi:dynamin family protein [Photobacterium atrarenae]|uniref:Dynamin family protein n=1 Tax=Photobacterium atrarenae TaxID=865757 RepID=A0ABY5GMX7_9GAMM|nr:dynamin family protein [Photobacterium atrarenae]UTV30516.1 dynamin family protein [Photobacterium atrarenae]
MTSLTTHQAFYQRTTALAKELAAIESEAKQQEQQLLDRIAKVVRCVDQASAVQAKATSAIARAVQSNLTDIRQVITAWQKKVSSYETGLSFRQKYGDSLLIFVYGKVKAGKSSLGNYMATGRGEPDAAWLDAVAAQLHRPEFFSEEINLAFDEAINHEEGFQIGSQETTSCIQGFQVPGMTWVDSPGLHSTHGENGDLAQKYVESADLIIYPMNSAQPGRQTDLHELESLLKAGKRILLLITRCDTLEYDLDDDTQEMVKTLVMKPEQNRRDQEAHVQNELDKLCANLALKNVDTSALTVSVSFAESQGNSEAAMDASGLNTLFSKLAAVIDSEGMALKKQVPHQNLQAFYRALLEDENELSITRLIQPLHNALSEITAQETQLETLTEQQLVKIQALFAAEVDAQVEQFADSQDLKSLDKALKNWIEQAIDQHYRPKLAQLCQKALDAMADLPQEMNLCEGLSFSDTTRQIEIDITRKRAAVGGGVGSVIGGIVGGMIGGPVGVAIGGTAGSLIGGAGGKLLTSTKTRDVVCGDNREEIKDALLTSGETWIAETLRAHQVHARRNVFTPVRAALTLIYDETLSLQHYIEGQRKDV